MRSYHHRAQPVLVTERHDSGGEAHVGPRGGVEVQHEALGPSRPR